MRQNQPECSKWDIWYGKEVEGHTDIGEYTLFVRRGDFMPYIEKLPEGTNRIWFCKEYLFKCVFHNDFRALLWAIEFFHVTCLDVPVELLRQLPRNITLQCRLYVRLGDVSLGLGDQISWGKAYNEKYIAVGEDTPIATNTPETYEEDIRLQ